MIPSRARAWAEIDLDALRANTAIAAGLSSSTSVMAVVKADAYGHGLVPVARTLAPLVDCLGVAGLREALEIRAAGVDLRILFLGACLPQELEGVIATEGLEATISSLAEARTLSAEAVRQEREVAVHVSIDTGMGRLGFLPASWSTAVAEEIDGLPGIRLRGLATHLPSADEDEAFTREQIAGFRRIAESFGNLELHLANSAGLLGFGEGWLGHTVRPGLMLYGIAPLPDAPGAAGLRAVMSLKSRVSLVRELPEGAGISYGQTFRTARSSRVATVAIGYGDGYPRHLSGTGAEVEIAGLRCPLLGRVTMDQIVVDVTDLPVAPVAGDEVLLFGPGATGLGVEELARRAGTIPWEILTGITPRVERVYRGGAESAAEVG